MPCSLLFCGTRIASPVGAGGSAAIVTSRVTLADLFGAAFTELSVLGADNSRAMLASIAGERRIGQWTRIGVGCIESFGYIQHQPRIATSQRKDRHGIERTASRHDARGAQAAESRLQADDVVECGRHASRSRRIGAQGKACEAERHGHRRT